MNNRIKILKSFFVFFACAIVIRAISIQLKPDPRLAKLSQRQFSSKVTAMPRRGLVFDRNGEGLVMSIKAYSLYIRPQILKKELSKQHRSRLAQNLGHIIKVSPSHLLHKINSDKSFVWIKRQMLAKEEEALRDHGVLDYSNEGIGIVEESRRFYPNQELASHVLGTVNVDGQGIEGLELFYDKILNGEKTRVSSSKDARGRRIFSDDQGLLAFNDGQSLVLTIDKALQYEAEKVLKKSIEDHQAKAGSILVAEVSSGEIFALANYPTFNPNNSKNISMDNRRNRAITDAYEPGSTFKPLVTAIALEKGKKPTDKIFCENGSFIVGGRRISEAMSHEKFEWLSLTEIIKLSSNVGAAKLALGLGANTIKELMNRLQVGQRTGIDLPGEFSGIYDSQSLHSSVRLANVGFGQGFTVTPLQMLSYYLALANNGQWIQPKLVKAVLAEDPDSLQSGTVRWKLDGTLNKKITRKLFSETIAKQIAQILQTVTEEGGTGTSAALDEWPVAGKTGTAQKVDSKTKAYSREKYVASFIGFAPAQSPKLVALVVLDEPKRDFYAATTAAPAFQQIMRTSLLRERVPAIDSHLKLLQLANKYSVESLLSDSSVTTSIQKTPTDPTTISSLERNDNSQIRIPDLRGLTLREVLRTIGNEPLELDIKGSGFLKQQIPPAQQWLEVHSKLRLIFEHDDYSTL